MTKILGLTDIFAGLLFTAGFYEVDFPRGLMIFIGIVLLAKGILFLANFFSWIDMAAGVVLIFGLFFLPPYILLGLAVFLGIKGLISLFSF
jgi:hypothetical protein